MLGRQNRGWKRNSVPPLGIGMAGASACARPGDVVIAGLPGLRFNGGLYTLVDKRLKDRMKTAFSTILPGKKITLCHPCDYAQEDNIIFWRQEW